MTPEERRTWIRLLAVLGVAALLRTAWSARPGVGAPEGVERDLVAAADTIDRLQREAARRSRPLRPGETIDPNRADPVDLDRLPGIGPGLAEAIVRTRAEGAFGTMADLRRVPGIGARTLEKLAPHIDLSDPPSRRRGRGDPQDPRTPVDLSTGDFESLQRLPGIGPALAARIIASRERDGPFASVEALIRVPGIGPATVERLRGRVRVR